MKNFKALTFLFLLSLSACNFAPKYKPTDLAIPTDWRSDNDEGDELANLSWWKQWGDEVLDEYIQVALNNNKDIKVAMWRVKQYLAEYKVARSPLFPQISLAGGALKEKVAIDADALPSGTDTTTANFDLEGAASYEIDFWGKIRNQAASAQFEYLAEIENRKTVILTLVGAVATAYVKLRELDLQLQLSERITETRKESLRIATARFEGGLTSKIEMDQSLAVYQESIGVIAELEKLIPQQENLICVLLGDSSHPIKRGKSLPDLVLPNAVPAGVPSDLLTRRPDIMQAENKLKAANADIGVARAAFFPQVSFSSLFGFDSLHIKRLFKKYSQNWEIGGSFLQAIFTGGALTGQLKIADAQKQEMLYQYEQKILEAFRDVNSSLIGFEKSKEILKADQVRVGALKDYLELAWYRYYEGQTEYLTVVDAEREVFSAELDMVDAQGDQFFVLVNLYKSLGGGWVEEVDHQALKYGDGS
jgi:outer membrane protein, multidrug efflux system